jgi:hypothetical protein
VRAAERKERKLRLMAYIDRARHIDKKTLRQIGTEVGLTFQRVQQLLVIIEQKPTRKLAKGRDAKGRFITL